MKKLLLISDSHGDLEGVKKILDREEYDYIFFSGDWGHRDKSILEEYNIMAVAGNHDIESDLLKKEIIEEIEGVKIYMTHGHWFSSTKAYVDYDLILNHTDKEYGKFDLYIHGHDHEAKHVGHFGRIFVNPGSTSQPRFQKHGTYMIITIINGEIELIETKKVKDI